MEKQTGYLEGLQVEPTPNQHEHLVHIAGKEVREREEWEGELSG